MSFELTVLPKVRFVVEGQLTGDDGKAIPFGFSLLIDRLGTNEETDAFVKEIKALEDKGVKTAIADVMIPRISTWYDVQNAGQDVPFNEENARRMYARKGMPLHIYWAFLRECGVKEKNS